MEEEGQLTRTVVRPAPSTIIDHLLRTANNPEQTTTITTADDHDSIEQFLLREKKIDKLDLRKAQRDEQKKADAHSSKKCGDSSQSLTQRRSLKYKIRSCGRRKERYNERDSGWRTRRLEGVQQKSL